MTHISKKIMISTKKAMKSVLQVLIVASAVLFSFSIDHSARAAGDVPVPPQINWSFSGLFGKFDKGQLQRGYKVYKEVCASCHSMNLISFRNLSQVGGPEFSEAQVKELAKEAIIRDDTVDGGERPGIAADALPAPYATDLDAIQANGGKKPPDLSVITKARSVERGFFRGFFDIIGLYQEGGADYVHALLVGFMDPAPKGWDLPPGQYFNKYFSGHNILMAPPLTDDIVTYDDGSPATVDQYAKDVTAFLAWSADPHMVERKQLGFQVLIFMFGFALLLYLSKKKLWARTK